jgi:hypothetical protein
MNTASRFWLLLTPFFFVAHALLFVLLWHTIDLSFEAIVQHLTVPFFQAMALAWVVGAFSLKDFALAARKAVSKPLVAALWCLEGALLFLYWSPPSGTDLTGIVARIAGIELLSAVILFLIYFLTTENFRKCISILPFSLLLLVLGSNGLQPWYQFVPHWLPEGWPFILKQTLALGGTVVCLIGFTEKAEKFVSARNLLAGIILSGIQPFVILAAMALVVNGYLYGFLASPWVHMVTISFSLGATCLLTAVLCLPRIKNSDVREPFSPVQKTSRPINLFVSWSVLASCAFASVIILRILFFPHWDWSTRALLSFLFVPLLQTSWLRWAQELHQCWRSTIRLFKHEYMFFVLICFEITILSYIAFSKNLWKMKSFLIIVSVWVGLKMVIFGAAILRGKCQGDFFCKPHKIFGAVTLILGMGTAFTGGLSNWIWMLPAIGSASVLVAVRWRPGTLTHSARLAGATAEAFVVLLLAMSFCILMTPQQQLIELLVYSGYILAALATTFVAMFMHSLRREPYPAGRSDDPNLMDPIFHKG